MWNESQRSTVKNYLPEKSLSVGEEWMVKVIKVCIKILVYLYNRDKGMECGVIQRIKLRTFVWPH